MVATIGMMGSGLKYVDHTYRDFSHFVDDGGQLTKHKKSGNNFPARLHRMLSEPRNYHAIAWMPHGRAWKILDKERLVAEIIPQYYSAKKYESFSRQLNGWGFKRLHQSGPDYGCYYHECFLRDLPSLTCLIRRLPSNLGKSTPYAEGEPNFYRISEKYPLPQRDLPPSESTRARAASLGATVAGDVAHGNLRRLMSASPGKAPQEAALVPALPGETGSWAAPVTSAATPAAVTPSSYCPAIDLGAYSYRTHGSHGYPHYAPGYVPAKAEYTPPTSLYPGEADCARGYYGGYALVPGPAFQDYRAPVEIPAPYGGYYSQESFAPRFQELPGIPSPSPAAGGGGASADLEPIPL